MKIVSVDHALYFRYSILEVNYPKRETNSLMFSYSAWYKTCDIFCLKAIIIQNTKDMHKIILKILSTINVYVPTEYHLKGWLGNLIWWLIMKWENRKLNLWKEAQWDNAQKVFSVVPATQWSLHKFYPFFLLLKLSEVSLLFNLGKRIRGCLIPCSVRQKIILL